MSHSNSRGDWLKSWAAKEHFIVANTHFRKQQENITTFTGPNKIPRQLDYILLDTTLRRLLRDAKSTNYPDLGSDHRAVSVALDITILQTLRPHAQSKNKP